MRKEKKNVKVLAVIPARFGSTRFPGKPLSLIHGKSLIQHTYDNAVASPLLDGVIIATDDDRIYKHAQGFHANVVMTDPNHPNGTERIAEVISNLSERPDIVVNIQGDEPCISPELIEALVMALVDNPDVPMSTVITPLTNLEDANNPSVVKCVINQKGRALYFSRRCIPGGKSSTPASTTSYYSHIGLYAYRTDFLFTYLHLPPTPLQLAEDLEQLKVLEHGFHIQTAIVEHLSLGVDTPEDIHKVESYLCKQNKQNISL
jgi:3-deoxy-manno-octulosonate cytidylyltransferase (CMP-KDO synthetase)